LLPQLGPDLNILAYAFNFKRVQPDGTSVVNTDLKLANRLNNAIYNRLSINPKLFSSWTLEKEFRKAVTGALAHESMDR
jgi:hypothetical protein